MRHAAKALAAITMLGMAPTLAATAPPQGAKSQGAKPIPKLLRYDANRQPVRTPPAPKELAAPQVR